MYVSWFYVITETYNVIWFLDRVEAVRDLILLNSLPLISNSDTSMICIAPEWSTPETISIVRDFDAIVNTLRDPLDVTQNETRRGVKRVLWKKEKTSEAIGAYYCEWKSRATVTRIRTMKMSAQGKMHCYHIIPWSIIFLLNCISAFSAKFEKTPLYVFVCPHPHSIPKKKF